MKVLHIEIARSGWEGSNDKGTPYRLLFKVSKGDINGRTQIINMTKTKILKEISGWMDGLDKVK